MNIGENTKTKVIRKGSGHCGVVELSQLQPLLFSIFNGVKDWVFGFVF